MTREISLGNGTHHVCLLLHALVRRAARLVRQAASCARVHNLTQTRPTQSRDGNRYRALEADNYHGSDEFRYAASVEDHIG